MSKTIEEIKDEYARSFAYKDWKELKSNESVLTIARANDEVAERYAQSKTQELTEWKESASKVFKNLDLQAIGKTLGIGLGEDVSTNVLPKVKGLIEQNKELVEMLSLFCMDMEERGRAYGDAYTMSKELLTKYQKP